MDTLDKNYEVNENKRKFRVVLGFLSFLFLELGVKVWVGPVVRVLEMEEETRVGERGRIKTVSCCSSLPLLIPLPLDVFLILRGSG